MDNSVDKLNLADKTITWFKNNRKIIINTAMAVCLSVTLFGCGNSDNTVSVDVNEPGLESNEETIDSNDEVTATDVIDEAIEDSFYPDEVTDVADNKSAVITSINLTKTYAKKLKKMAEEVKESDEYTEGLKQTVAEFDALYRFIMGDTYKDTSITFEDLSTSEKISAIDGTMSVGEIVTTVEPNYKEDIKEKYEEIKEKYKNSKFKKKFDELYDKYEPKLRDKAVDIAAKGYNSISDFISDVKEEASKQK